MTKPHPPGLRNIEDDYLVARKNVDDCAAQLYETVNTLLGLWDDGVEIESGKVIEMLRVPANRLAVAMGYKPWSE